MASGLSSDRFSTGTNRVKFLMSRQYDFDVPGSYLADFELPEVLYRTHTLMGTPLVLLFTSTISPIDHCPRIGLMSFM